ncbi:MAG: phage adaptor protein [Pseudomonadales bacterium]
MAYETVSDLIKAFREDERDAVAPHFWSDSQLVRFANGALAAFAEKTKSIIDDGFELEFGLGDDVIDYPEAIIDVLDAEITVGAKTWPVDVRSPGEVRRSRLPKSGKVCLILADSAVGKLRLVPAPAAAGLLSLQAVRRPLKELGKDSKIPDVNPVHREYLLLHMKHRAYNVADAETFDAAKAVGFLVEFDRECQRIYEDALRRRGGARTIKYVG